MTDTMDSQSIPACRDCEHYCEDDIFSFCKFHYFETPNYITGTINKTELPCYRARGYEKYCGHKGKNFKQRQAPVGDEVPSFRDVVKGFFKMDWLF